MVEAPPDRIDAYRSGSSTASESIGEPSPRQTHFSIVVAARNEARTLAQTLDGLLQQDYAGPFEILVIDGKSTDDTVAIAERYAKRDPRVRVLHNARRLASTGRNIGIAASAGEFVAIIDGHTSCDRQFLSRLRDAFARSGADCIGFPQPLVHEPEHVMQSAIVAARASLGGRHPASVTYKSESGFVSPHPAALVYRRRVLEQVGGFDESFDACQDLELTYRVALGGFRCYYDAQFSTPYFARASIGELFKQQMRYGRGRVRLLRRHPDTFAVTTFLPAVLVFCAVALLPLAAVSSSFATLYLTGAAIYLGTIVAISLWSARLNGWHLLPYLPLLLITIHAGAGIGSLIELASANVPARRHG